MQTYRPDYLFVNLFVIDLGAEAHLDPATAGAASALPLPPGLRRPEGKENVDVGSGYMFRRASQTANTSRIF